MQKIIFSLFILASVTTHAACPVADSFFEKGMNGSAVAALETCATAYNDDESQLKLVKLYANGQYGLQPDLNQVLYYSQLAAETGNAQAQLLLAEILISENATPETRDILLKYRSKVQKNSFNDNQGDFNGDFLHPYALLMLASESAEKKWYYPSKVRSAPPKAISLYKGYQISDEGKREAIRQASQFKTRKLLQTAK